MENIRVCVGKTCRSLGSELLFDYIDGNIKKYDCPVLKQLDDVELSISLCSKYCEHGPLVTWNNYLFLHMDESRSNTLIQAIYEHNTDNIDKLCPVKLDKKSN